MKKEFLAVFKKEDDKQAISLFLNWFKQLSENQRMDQTDYEELEQVYKTAEEVNAMLITALKKEREELYMKGKSDGIEKGMEKGMEKGKREQRLLIARTMLMNREPIEKIMQYTGFSKIVILKLKVEL